jgi:hypothetical protein
MTEEVAGSAVCWAPIGELAHVAHTQGGTVVVEHSEVWLGEGTVEVAVAVAVAVRGS